MGAVFGTPRQRLYVQPDVPAPAQRWFRSGKAAHGMQYEILLGQVTNEHTQKEVTDYIKKVYNPANKDRQIGFQLTRRPRRKYKEDDLTYNRNLLGHGDIEKAVSEEKIRQLSRSIMDVLWFSLWNKAE